MGVCSRDDEMMVKNDVRKNSFDEKNVVKKNGVEE